MSTKQCGQCGEILVKQSLNTDGTVLNASLKLEYDKYIDNYNRMLECSECGGLCYHSKKTTNPPHDGHGLCKKCGGDKRKPSKNEKKLFENENRKKFNLFNFKIWSCPVHGTHDRPKEEFINNDRVFIFPPGVENFMVRKFECVDERLMTSSVFETTTDGSDDGISVIPDDEL